MILKKSTHKNKQPFNLRHLAAKRAWESRRSKQFFYCTHEDKRISRDEAKEIIVMLRSKCKENDGWIELVENKKWGICFVEIKAESLNSAFSFMTEYGEDPVEIGALRLGGEVPPVDVVDFTGKCDAFSCLIPNGKYGKLIEEIIKEMNKITNNKIRYEFM